MQLKKKRKAQRDPILPSLKHHHGNDTWSWGCGLFLVGSCPTKFQEINPRLKY